MQEHQGVMTSNDTQIASNAIRISPLQFGGLEAAASIAQTVSPLVVMLATSWWHCV
jgi:hypothetical protein